LALVFVSGLEFELSSIVLKLERRIEKKLEAKGLLIWRLHDI
jgi:hypothetical protein